MLLPKLIQVLKTIKTVKRESGEKVPLKYLLGVHVREFLGFNVPSTAQGHLTEKGGTLTQCKKQNVTSVIQTVLLLGLGPIETRNIQASCN